MSETTHLQNGDEIRLLGSGGAPVLLTVGRPFSAKDIYQRLGTGEWRYEGDKPYASDAGPQPRTEQPSEPGDTPVPDSPQPGTEHLPRPDEGKPSVDPRRPAVNAPKADWVAYVAGLKHMSLEDASAYTKDDLIEMAS